MQGRVSAARPLPAEKAAERAKHQNKKDLQAGRSIFSAEEFQRMMTRYDDQSLNVRIHETIINHSQQHANHHRFHLFWTDSKLHCHALKVTLTHHYSLVSVSPRFLTEISLMHLYSKYFKHELKCWPGYYCLDVEEIPSAQPEIPNNKLLSMWFTLDGLVGELRDVSAGEHLTGSEVMRIFRYFDDFLRIKNLFIYDDTALVVNAKNKLPLRVITALATGQTWFERQVTGLRLFNATNLAVGELKTIKQHSQQRKQSLRELQTLPLRKWHAMLKADQQMILEALYRKYFPLRKETSSHGLFKSGAMDKTKAAMFGDDTVQMLAVAVREAAKEQQEISQELLQLNDLLCGNIMFEFGHALTADPKKPADYWLKSRVQQLLWESLIWIRQRPEEEKEHEPSMEYGSFSK